MPTPIQAKKVYKNYKDVGGEDHQYGAGEEVIDGVNEPKDSALGKISHFVLGKGPKGWELLDAQKHTAIFPISGLGQLPDGHGWYVQVNL